MKIEAINKEEFRPKTITLTINIESKKELNDLRAEFKCADLEEDNLQSYDSNESLPLLSMILGSLEKEL